MKKQFTYFYLMKNDPNKIKDIAPFHVKYWKGLQLTNYTGGPFADRSGGLITFETVDVDEALRIASSDPFLIENLIENKWLKEWVVE